MTEPCDLTAVEMRRLIGRKRLSPIELVESCIARIEMVNPVLNAVVATCYDRAREEARAMTERLVKGDELPPLFGLPVGIKDLNDTEGLRTTYGSPLYKDHVPNRDERLVRVLREAGAIVLAKTNTPEFGAGGNTTTNEVYGYTRNPFDVARACGGSSGGAAVALATGMMPLAQGSDSGGSLRKPATFCGITALRPTAGLVPSDKRAVGLTTSSVQGPMARDAADTALFLQTIVGSDGCDPLSYNIDRDDYRVLPEVDLSRLRVAVSVDFGSAPVDDGIRKTFEDRLAQFRGVFASCEERQPDLETANDVFWILRGVLFLANHLERYEKHRDQLGPNIVSNVEAGLAMTAEEIGWAYGEHTRLYRAFQEYFQDIDVLITPGQAVTPTAVEQRNVTEINGMPMKNYLHASTITSAITLTGHPAAAIPCGYDHTGAPFGLQVCGPKNGDMFTLGVARALERYFADKPDLARPIPDLEPLKP
ncbi:MAG: amidase family protein [Alphaproteobacteria bacterium]|jgi:Asp-tRNA(Asn)/Glu-tRNA(Gln) amidotransferase A subunit family amidase|nr:amidase family protein [Alphaproteobacteria bacterium]